MAHHEVIEKVRLAIKTIRPDACVASADAGWSQDAFDEHMAKSLIAILRPIIREEALEEAEDTINEVGDHADANAYLNAIRELKEKS